MIVSDLSAWTWVILLLGTIFSSEALLRLPLQSDLIRLAKLLKKIFGTLQSPHVSDHWKEQVILRYAANLFGYGLKIPVQLAVAFIPLILALRFGSSSFEQVLVLTLDPIMSLSITIVSLVYLLLRMR